MGDGLTMAADPADKFRLVKDIGTMEVPKDYNHATCLAWFKQEYKSRLYVLQTGLIDANYPRPSRVLKPGDRLSVQAWMQVGHETTTQERLAFLRSKQGVLVGAQGMVLTHHTLREQLDNDFRYSSMDEQDRLWEDSRGQPRVPVLSVSLNGGYGATLGNFMNAWPWDNRLLLFRLLEEFSAEAV